MVSRYVGERLQVLEHLVDLVAGLAHGTGRVGESRLLVISQVDLELLNHCATSICGVCLVLVHGSEKRGDIAPVNKQINNILRLNSKPNNNKEAAPLH